MSWHILKDCENSPCLQGQEVVSSGAICWDGERFAPSSGPTILGRYCLPDSETESCLDSRFGMMSKHSTETHGEDESMLSQAGSPARTSAQPAKVQESTAQGLECGSTWPGSFARYDRDSSSWKTPQCSLLEGLDVFSETWPRWGMMRNGACWELTTLAGLTNGNGFGSWPTPTKSDAKRCRDLRIESLGKRAQIPGAHWNLAEHVAAEYEGYPTPQFVAWLMAWPQDWTSLKPLETDKFQQWQQQHSGF